jgi:hypothetical protein
VILVARGRDRGYAGRVKSKTDKIIGAPRAATMLGIPLSTLYGMAERGEVPIVGEHRPGEPYQFQQGEIRALARARSRQPRREASDGSQRGRRASALPGERVRAFGRVTDEEIELWKSVAPNGQYWPWMRALANAAAQAAKDGR